MPAPEKSSLKNSSIEKLGIIAGGGSLPGQLVRACEEQGIEPFIVALKGQADASIIQGREHMLSRLGAVGSIIATLKSHNIRDLVLIGSVRRPSLSELRPDLKTAGFFAKLGFAALGDSDLLSAIRKELEGEGFHIHGVQDFIHDLTAKEGVMGRYKPDKGDREDIKKGIAVSQALGLMDVGQAAIVQEGIVLGVEAIEGTTSLIQRCAALKRKGRGGVLIKTCKPQQDKALDLPTIGPDTVIQCAAAGLSGIAVHAGNSLVVDLQQVIELADKYKIFVTGVKIDDAE